jgi:adrenodoxin-NADP+ reductase
LAYPTSIQPDTATPTQDGARVGDRIGQGNVALDVARMLLTPPRILEKYDVLRRSAVRHVSIIGRRGPLQAAFTTKELRELTTLASTSMIPLSSELIVPPPTSTKLTRQQSRILRLQQSSSVPSPGSTPTTQPPRPPGTKTWSIDFFRSPTGFTPDSQHLTLSHTTLDRRDPAVPTGQTSLLRTDLVVTVLGHHAAPLQACYDSALGHLRTVDHGRVLDAAGGAVRRVYASGWAATGVYLSKATRQAHLLRPSLTIFPKTELFMQGMQAS